MAEQQTNALLSTQKSSDSELQAVLHPLVLLTISDYITRHTLRNLSIPVVGGLLGQQNGREITIEHAFECLTKSESNYEGAGSDVVLLDEEWFKDRLQQMKDVHRVPQLDLVGWFTILPATGPQPHHLPLHMQILKEFNDSAILLGFHPTAVAGAVGGKLPITIYESNLEADSQPAPSNAQDNAKESVDQEMKDGEDEPLKLRFKELSYTIESGEAEMIGVDFVAKGGGNATAVDESGLEKNPAAQSHKGFHKKSAKSPEEKQSPLSEQNILSSTEQELIASLTAKANAIKMLHSRIALITSYLRNLPPNYSGKGVQLGNDAASGDLTYTEVNHSILRSIQAVLIRLNLVMPSNSNAFDEEVLSEQNDGQLVALLSYMAMSVKEAKELGRKFNILETAKTPNKKNDRTSVTGIPGIGSNVWEPQSNVQTPNPFGMDLA